MSSTEPVRVYSGMRVNALGTGAAGSPVGVTPGALISVSSTVATKVFAKDTRHSDLAVADNGDALRELLNADTANTIYIGGDNTVTNAGGANPGYPIKPGQSFQVAGGAGKLWLGDVWAMADTSAVNVSTIQW